MPEKDILSQEEIDALLDSVDDDAEGVDEENTAKSSEGEAAAETTGEGDTDKKEQSQAIEPVPEEISLVNFTNQERNVRGQLPVLEKIHDRTCNYFKQDIYQLMAKEFHFEQDTLSVHKYKDFMGTLENPTLMRIFQLKPLRGKALIFFDSTFIYGLVNVYFGGGTQFASKLDRTDFTATEIRIMDIIIQKFEKNIERAWQPIVPMQVTKLGGEINPLMVHITEPNEVVLVSRFKLDFGQESGQLGFVIPYAMVEPIKQQLELGAARPDNELDPNWVNSLREELMDVALEISAFMAESQTSFGEVMAWKEGDYIPMQQRETITLDVEGIPSYEATMGTSGETLALQILKQIKY